PQPRRHSLLDAVPIWPADEQPLSEEPAGAPQSQITPVTGMRGQRIGSAAPGSGPSPLNGRSSSASARRGGSSRSPCSRPCSVQSEEHTSELQSRFDLVCRLLLEKKKESRALKRPS